MTDDADENGRARNKRATRRALRRAVLELSAARGLATIRVDEIAARAGVSPRTFFNYFDTKEDAAVVDVFTVSDEDLESFGGGRGPDPWAELSAMMVTAVERAFAADPDLVDLLRLQAADPAIQAHQIGYFAAFLQRLSDAVAKRLGAGRRRRLTAELMAGSCITAVRVGLDQWAAGGGRGTPATHLASAFAVFDPAFGPVR